ncbi:hypothetical protein [Rhodococcus sp. WAY2]|uniref:hypothetical protein n=1 Tax=Rhodococcus sp. WAY2 TaxID=2663121 RepID=UPI00131F6DDC|nr:hypothetical protein [Rhodococcus sp. WAY2]QHE69808.1 hypothetical protein GFS60_03378 [Rhodococcus sp. WAY2]
MPTSGAAPLATTADALGDDESTSRLPDPASNSTEATAIVTSATARPGGINSIRRTPPLIALGLVSTS